jgi:hypothetical protein
MIPLSEAFGHTVKYTGFVGCVVIVWEVLQTNTVFIAVKNTFLVHTICIISMTKIFNKADYCLII